MDCLQPPAGKKRSQTEGVRWAGLELSLRWTTVVRTEVICHDVVSLCRYVASVKQT